MRLTDVAQADAPARTAFSRTELASLTELLRMLSRRAFTGARLTRAAEHVHQAGCDPEAGDLGGSAAFMAYALATELAEQMASSESLAELHGQVSGLLARPLPPARESADAAGGYFAWLDAQLAERQRDWGGLAAMAMELGIDTRLRLLLVFRSDLPRILSLARGLRLPIACTT